MSLSLAVISTSYYKGQKDNDFPCNRHLWQVRGQREPFQAQSCSNISNWYCKAHNDIRNCAQARPTFQRSTEEHSHSIKLDENFGCVASISSISKTWLPEFPRLRTSRVCVQILVSLFGYTIFCSSSKYQKLLSWMITCLCYTPCTDICNLTGKHESKTLSIRDISLSKVFSPKTVLWGKTWKICLRYMCLTWCCYFVVATQSLKIFLELDLWTSDEHQTSTNPWL